MVRLAELHLLNNQNSFISPMDQSALQDVLTTKMENPYCQHPPLKLAVLQLTNSPCVITWDFSQSTVQVGARKVNKVAVVTDGQTLAKFTVFEQFANKMRAGNTYIVRGYGLTKSEPPYIICVDAKTMVFRTSDMRVPDELKRESEVLANPPSPLIPADEWETRQGLRSIEGQVVEASTVRKVKVGRDFVPMKKVKVQKGTKSISVCPWREAALHQLTIGERVTLTHLVGGKVSTLHSTGNTSFVTPDTVEKRSKIVGVMEEADGNRFLQVLLNDNTVLNIHKELWGPFDHQLKSGPIIAILKTG
ncbi:uncharacterized protein LOC115577999 isoform X2 [Sparus aurata]|uniref:uncharacterized protein LOC115577999 isoform X2 n=2 Tax=Sparus aurata TaxID=8175 RepID=UPI0011C0FBBE|nr:uncharacterized protein LOC115577999 isoform X2 [Sparus aurata]